MLNTALRHSPSKSFRFSGCGFLCLALYFAFCTQVYGQSSESWKDTVARMAKTYQTTPQPAATLPKPETAKPVTVSSEKTKPVAPVEKPVAATQITNEPAEITSNEANTETNTVAVNPAPAPQTTEATPASPSETEEQALPANNSQFDLIEPPEIPDDEELVRRFAPGEELVLSVVAGGFARGEVFAITTEESFRVGLLELSEILDFVIDVSDDSRQAFGWFITPSNVFDLSTDENDVISVTSKGVQSTLTPDEYSIDGDLMVNAEALSDWFGLTFGFNEAQLVLEIASSQTFPFEAAEARRLQQLSGNYKAPISVLPPIDNDYQLYTPPLLDFQTFVRESSTTTNYGYSIASRQDLAFLSTSLFLAGDKNDDLRDARLTFTRESPEGEMLGPLGLTEISIGDVLPINAGVGNTSGFGRGISVSNIKEQLADNRLVNFTGVIQAGWDVELYRNGILLANEFDIQSGRYEFTDIELLFGTNDFELIFYGPQGEIERRNESYIVDQNALRRNQNSFRFSVVDSNKTLLGITEIAEEPELEGVNAGLVYERGITDWYTLGIGGSFLNPEVGETIEQFSLRNNLSFGSFGILNTVVQWDNEDRQNLLANYRTRIGETNLALNWQQNRIPQVIDDVTTLVENDSYGITFSGRLFTESAYPIGYENVWRRSDNEINGTTDTFRQSLSLLTRYGSFNHSFLGTKVESSLDDDWLISGDFGYRHRFGRLFTRLFSTFTYQPELDLSAVGAAFNYPVSNTLGTELRYAYSVVDSSHRYDARINWLGENVTLSGFASYSDSDNWSLNVTARFSLGINNETDSLLLTSRPISQSGALAVRVFEDLDLDKEYDEGEPLLNDVEVQAAQVSRRELTKNGTAFINRLPNNRRTDIVVDETTLPDYTYMRVDDGFSVTGRRGVLQFAEIPFTRGGELDGTVYFVNADGVEEPLPYVDLELVNDNDEVIATTKSEFDGFYLFEKVLPGNYRLVIEERTLRQKNAIQQVTKRLDISNQGDLFTDVDLVLRELKSADGYIAQVGSFKSLTLLKVYYGLLKNRIPSDVLDNAFFLRQANGDRFLMGISYSEQQTSPQDSCNSAVQYDIDCQVEFVQFGY